MFEMQGDVFRLRATFVEVTEFVKGGPACLHFLAVLSGNPGHSLLGLLKMHVVGRSGSKGVPAKPVGAQMKKEFSAP